MEPSIFIVYTEEKMMLIFTNEEVQVFFVFQFTMEKTLPIRSLNLIYQHKTFYL